MSLCLAHNLCTECVLCFHTTHVNFQNCFDVLFARESFRGLLSFRISLFGQHCTVFGQHVVLELHVDRPANTNLTVDFLTVLCYLLFYNSACKTGTVQLEHEFMLVFEVFVAA